MRVNPILAITLKLIRTSCQRRRRDERIPRSHHRSQRNRHLGSRDPTCILRRPNPRCCCLPRQNLPRRAHPEHPGKSLAGVPGKLQVRTVANSSRVRSMEAGPTRKVNWEIVLGRCTYTRAPKGRTTWLTTLQLLDGPCVQSTWNSPIQRTFAIG